MTEAILEFWTNDLKALNDVIVCVPNMSTPELKEKTIGSLEWDGGTSQITCEVAKN